MRRAWFQLGACALAAVLVAGCETIGAGRKIDYRNTPTLPRLEIPPDLAALPEQNVPAAPPAGSPAAASPAEPTGTASVLPQYPGVKLAREGQTRYVVVTADAASVWESVRDFLAKTGLPIAREDAAAGFMETEWAENRAYVRGGESSAFAKWLRSMQSTSMRDKYIVRLERGAAPGTIEVYLSHRRMDEVDPDALGAPRPGWKPGASDPVLEAEMLQRLVVHLGGSSAPEEVAAAAPDAAMPSAPVDAPAEPSARLTRNGNGAPLLTLEDSLERAWRRVGLSLDRIGFTVEDRDRSKGIYYVRYIDPDTQAEEKGFFSRLFSSDEPAAPHQYQVHVKPNDNGSSVEVLDKGGAPASSTTGERILSLLYEQLK